MYHVLSQLKLLTGVIVFDYHPSVCLCLGIILVSYQDTLGTYEHHDFGIVATSLDNAFTQKSLCGTVSTSQVKQQRQINCISIRLSYLLLK